jgi:hypothetical protein
MVIQNVQELFIVEVPKRSPRLILAKKPEMRQQLSQTDIRGSLTEFPEHR